MATAFKPGHPVAFWLAIVTLVYVIYSGLYAGTHIDECRENGSASQHWSYWPPGWVCDG